MSEASNVIWNRGLISREDRKGVMGQNGCTLWLTGLPSSGKSTLAFALEYRLFQAGYSAYVMDGDNIRHGLNKNLGFSHEDRTENIRRISEVAKLFADAGVLVITSFISPYCEDRDRARALHKETEIPFIEILVDTPIKICEQRDPKGHYAKARAGQIKDFTGVDAPYERPKDPEVIINAGALTPEQEVDALMDYLVASSLIVKKN